MVARRVPKQEDFGCPDELSMGIIENLEAGLASLREVLSGLKK
jgi:hypothetical protein